MYIRLYIGLCESETETVFNGTIVVPRNTVHSRQKKKKKKSEKSSGSATITNRSSFRTPRGGENRQIQTSTNRTNCHVADLS